jgi:hypothetical protein
VFVSSNKALILFLLVCCFVYFSILKKEAVCCYELPGNFYNTTWRHTPKDCGIYSTRRLLLSVGGGGVSYSSPIRLVSIAETFPHCTLTTRQTGSSHRLYECFLCLVSDVTAVTEGPSLLNQWCMYPLWYAKISYCVCKIEKKKTYICFYDKHWIIRARFGVTHRRPGCKYSRFGSAISVSLSYNFSFSKISSFFYLYMKLLLGHAVE